MATSNKKSAVDSINEWLPLVLKVGTYAGLAYGGYRLFRHFIPEGTGGGQGSAHNTGGTQVQPGNTYTDNNYHSFADAIEGALWRNFWGITENEAKVVETLKKMRNTSDVVSLIKAYGVRGVLEEKYDLPTSIAMYLSQGNVDDVNSYYYSKGINYVF